MLENLLETPSKDWPKTYAALSEIGLQPEIVAWLREIFAGEYPEPQPEPAVVASFLRALLTEEIRTAILKTELGVEQRDRIEPWLESTGTVGEEPGTPALAADLVAYLQGIGPECWPSVMTAEIAVG